MRKFFLYPLVLVALGGCFLPKSDELSNTTKADNGDMATFTWGPDPNAPPVSCYELEREIATWAAACALQMANGCDKVRPADEPRQVGDCPGCDYLDNKRAAHALAHCDAPRVVE